MKSRHLLKGIGMLMFLMFTTGIILPWVISNVVMPLWMIMFTLGGVLCLWIVILERPYRRLIKFAVRTFRQGEIKNVD
jgi:Flp pilus assembly protein TadB